MILDFLDSDKKTWINDRTNDYFVDSSLMPLFMEASHSA